MSRTVLVSFASALLGAAFGGIVAVWVAPSTPAPVAEEGTALPTSESVDGPGPVELERRLAAVERAVTMLEARTRARSAPAEPPTTDPVASGPHPVDTPVFEAAVMDIMERAQDSRAEERAAAREEKRRQKARQWANELTLQLGLSPAQTEGLIEIQADLDDELERQRERGNGPDTPYVSKEQRRAAREAARQSAERQLRALLTPPQLETYEGLDERSKLYRPKDAD